MLLIYCPYCEIARPEIEFRHGGQAHLVRPADPMAATDEEWAAYLFCRENPKGLHHERWRHIHGCGRFFNCQRDTVSDRIISTYKVGEPPPSSTSCPRNT
ncbi:MAG: sarcosine oxidase subunit delta [Cupriavidus sp.]|nr:sarcosine oxidase subunit delta [Cupriavidus sp.]MCA3704381.1 sarcosine oxidase subunit delta [Methylobacterium sp.]